jgi:cobalt-zinc-cadmium efflux system outer membrane protein
MRSLTPIGVTILLLAASVSRGQGAVFAEPTGPITLQQAVHAALQGSPRLAAFDWELRAADARVLQAGLRPNPELALEIENLRLKSGPGVDSDTRSLSGSLEQQTLTVQPGSQGEPVELAYPRVAPVFGGELERESGAPSGLAESEITLSISQVIELGGKRAKRVALARDEKQLVQWDYEAVRADVVAETARAFVDVLVAQERIERERELVALAEDVARSTALRVDAGQVSPMENNRAEIALSTTGIALSNAERALQAARARLASKWGGTDVLYTEALGDLADVSPVPDFEMLVDALNRNPDLARWAAEIAVRDARFTLERARRIPNPSVELGLRREGISGRSVSRFGSDTGGALAFSRTDVEPDRDAEYSLVLGFSVPLPIFDRNQGNIAEAEALASKTAEERRLTAVTLHAALVESRESAVAAFDELQTLDDEVLAKAAETLGKTREGYELGKFSYLDVLDAQRTLFDAQAARLDALSRYHAAVVNIERLTGQMPDEVQEQINESTN